MEVRLISTVLQQFLFGSVFTLVGARIRYLTTNIKFAKLKYLVGGISHNIMSVTTLYEYGWEFNQGPDGFHIKDVKIGRTVKGYICYAGCPWIKLEPAWSSEFQLIISEGWIFLSPFLKILQPVTTV